MIFFTDPRLGKIRCLDHRQLVGEVGAVSSPFLVEGPSVKPSGRAVASDLRVTVSPVILLLEIDPAARPVHL